MHRFEDNLKQSVQYDLKQTAKQIFHNNLYYVQFRASGPHFVMSIHLQLNVL